MKRNFIRFPGGKSKCLTFSFDDGVIEDVQLIKVFNKYGIKSTFNLNSKFLYPCEVETNCVDPDKLKEIYSGHEIASHGYSHAFAEQLSDSEAMYEFYHDREILEKLSGQIVRGMAYPWGHFNGNTHKIAQNAGLVYGRTCGQTGQFLIPSDWMHWDMTCHQQNGGIMDERCEKFVTKSPDNESYDQNAWLFSIWGHAYEFSDDVTWNRIEGICSELGGRDDTWYATNIEIYDYVQAYRNMIVSTDGLTVHNQYSFDIWCSRHGETIRFPAGETVVLD